MTDMDKVFAGCMVSKSDSFVVDYTNDGDKSVAKRGVEITPTDPCYAHGAFHLIDGCGVDYYTVNFEHTPAFFTGEDGKKLRNCECMFSSCYAKKKKWVLLLEMKYSKEKNIKENAEDALDELEKTRDRLFEKGVLNHDEYRLYFDISFPEHTLQEPFQSFLLGPKELLDYKEKQKVNLMGHNTVLVANGAYLRPACMQSA